MFNIKRKHNPDNKYEKDKIKTVKQSIPSSLRLFQKKNAIIYSLSKGEKPQICTNQTRAWTAKNRGLGDAVPSVDLKNRVGVDKKHGSYARYLAAKVQNATRKKQCLLSLSSYPLTLRIPATIGMVNDTFTIGFVHESLFKQFTWTTNQTFGYLKENASSTMIRREAFLTNSVLKEKGTKILALERWYNGTSGNGHNTGLDFFVYAYGNHQSNMVRAVQISDGTNTYTANATRVPVAAAGVVAAGTAGTGNTSAQGRVNAGIILRDQTFGGVYVGPISAYQFTNDANLTAILNNVTSMNPVNLTIILY